MTLSAKAISTPRWVMLVILALALSLLLSACGFKLKQSHNLPFNTLYTNIAENSAFGAQLRRILLTNSPNLRLAPAPEQAEVQLIELSYSRTQRELSLDPNGHVEDYELQLQLQFTLIDQLGNTLLAPTTLTITRDIPNSPETVHAKQMEINSLFADMELSLVDRLVRRLSSLEVQQAYERSQRTQDSSSAPSDQQPPVSARSF